MSRATQERPSHSSSFCVMIPRAAATYGDVFDEPRLLHHADPSAGEGLARLAARGPRGVHPRRRARLHRRLCRRASHRPRREHHLVDDVHLHADRGDQAHQARHRHAQHAEQSSGRGRRERRDARPHARRPLHHGHLAGRADVRRRGVRQSRRRPQRDVPRMHQPGAGDLGERCAIQHQGQVLEHRAREAADARSRAGALAEAAAEAASADRRHGGRAVLQGRDGSRRARLGSDLGQLPDAAVGEVALAEIRRGLRARRAPRRSGELARREIDFRGGR